MANFNFGIDCDSKNAAEKLNKFISELNIYQDGLDCQDTRVMVISKSSLIDELKRFGHNGGGIVIIEVWPSDQEYDEAESSGHLELHEV